MVPEVLRGHERVGDAGFGFVSRSIRPFVLQTLAVLGVLAAGA